MANPGDLIILSFFSKMFIVVGFVGSEFGIFGGFGWVRSSVLVGEPGFGRVRSSTSRVRSSSKFVIFGFDPTLLCTSRTLAGNCRTYKRSNKKLILEHSEVQIFV